MCFRFVFLWVCAVRFVFCVSVGLCCVFLWVVLGDEGDGVPVAFSVLCSVWIWCCTIQLFVDLVLCVYFLCVRFILVCVLYFMFCVCVKLFVDLVVVFRGGDVVFEGAEVVIWWWWFCLAAG
jgi:hypothetical protein